MSQTFRVAFSDHKFGSDFNQFDTILKLESYYVFITSSHDIFCEDFDSLHRLSNAAHVNHGLITFLDGSGAMQNFDLGLKVLDALSLVRVLSRSSLG